MGLADLFQSRKHLSPFAPAVVPAVKVRAEESVGSIERVKLVLVLFTELFLLTFPVNRAVFLINRLVFLVILGMSDKLTQCFHALLFL